VADAAFARDTLFRMSMAIIAAISGSAVVNVIITIIIFAVIYMLIEWAVKAIPIGEPFAKIIRVIMILAAVIFLINALLSLNGNAFIKW
jgi:hypothetical protein